MGGSDNVLRLYVCIYECVYLRTITGKRLNQLSFNLGRRGHWPTDNPSTFSADLDRG